MDYCAPCQRHLNGALSCPGCGAPASAAVRLPDAEPLPRAAQTRRTRRKPKKRRRTLVVTAAVLAVGGAGVLSLASPQSGEARTPVPTPTEDQQPGTELATAVPSASAAGRSASGSPKPARSSAGAHPSGSPSSTAPTASSQPPSATPKPQPTTAGPSKPPPSPSPTCTRFLFWCTS